MKLRLAICIFMVALAPWKQTSGQSMPVGQITRQIGKSTVENFHAALDQQLQASDVSAADAVHMLDAITTAKPKDVATAAKTALTAVPTDPATAVQAEAAVDNAKGSATPASCDQSGQQSYRFNYWFPVVGCSPDGILNFFKVSGALSIVNTVQYLYNPNQSTNQVSADFFTATFPQGFQAIFSGAATAGSSQSSGTSPTSTSTDSVSTAVSKLEQGGDFNVRFPFPIFYHATNSYGAYVLTSPAVGFNVSGLTGQNTITQSTEYNVNIPLEFYAQTSSIEQTDSASNALLYVDVKPAMELVSPAFASAIGLTSNRYFFLGQVAAGIEFAKSVRVGFQYFFGPEQVYQVPSTTGGITAKTAKVGGIHLVISFSPSKSKS